MPGEYFEDLPAKVKVIGMTDATPIPVIENPINTVQNIGNKTTRVMPEAIRDALNKYVFSIPIRPINLSE